MATFLFFGLIFLCSIFLHISSIGSSAKKIYFSQNIETPEKIYEKDDSPVEEYLYNGVMHYLFTNLDNQVAVWIVGDLEYSISTTLSKDELKELVQSVY